MIRTLQHQPSYTQKDYTQHLSYASILISGVALFPIINRLDVFAYFPINRVIMLAVFIFSSQFTQELTQSKETLSCLQARYHCTQTRMLKSSLLFLPIKTQVTLKRYALILGSLCLISLYFNRTLLDHIIVVALSLMMVMFELDVLFYYYFKVKRSTYDYFLIRKGADLGLNYFVSTYILVFGFMESMTVEKPIFLISFALLSLVLLGFFIRRFFTAMRIKVLVLCCLLLVGCSLSKPDVFTIHHPDIDYFGKLVPTHIIQIALGDIKPVIKENKAVHKGASLYRDGYGTLVSAPLDGKVEIIDQTFRYISNQYECQTIIPELDFYHLDIKATYSITNMQGDFLAEGSIKYIDYQYLENAQQYQDMNTFKLHLKLDADNLFPQSVIVKVPHHDTIIPSQYVFASDGSLYIDTYEGMVVVDGSYDADTDTYIINTQLEDGLELYAIKRD